MAAKPIRDNHNRLLSRLVRAMVLLCMRNTALGGFLAGRGRSPEPPVAAGPARPFEHQGFSWKDRSVSEGLRCATKLRMALAVGEPVRFLWYFKEPFGNSVGNLIVSRQLIELIEKHPSFS